MNASPRGILRFFSSRRTLTCVVGGWVSFYILAAIWTNEPFSTLVRNFPERPLLAGAILLSLGAGLSNFVRSFRARAGRGRASALAWAVLPCGLLVFLSGFFLSLKFRSTETRLVGLGNVVRPAWETEPLVVAGVDPGLADGWIDLEKENWLFAHEPRLTLAGGDSEGRLVRSFPPTKIGSTYYHVLNFGFAPEARVAYKGDTRIQGLVALKILAFGAADDFRVPPYPFRFLVSLHPNQVLRGDGRTRGRFDPKVPYYRIRVYDGDEMVAEGDSKGHTDFGDFSFTFGRTSFWLRLEMVKDPALPLLRLGLLLFLLGIAIAAGRSLFSAVSAARNA